MLSQKIKKHINQLQQKKFRKEFQEFIVEGIKGVTEALAADAEVVVVVVEGNKRNEKEIEKILRILDTEKIPYEFCGRKDIDEIKTTDTFPGVLAVVAQKELAIEDIAHGHIICLDQIKDPGNLGTIIRTADWFGIQNILLSENCVDEYNPKVVRSTMGSIFHVNIVRTQNVFNSLSQLKNTLGYSINALDMAGKDFSAIKHTEKAVYIFGSESHGISRELDSLVDNRYTISGKGSAESLNVAVAAGILMSRIY